MLQSNDWKLLRQRVLTPVTLADTVQEQSVELDYVLPDYYPDFFRLLHCSAETAVTRRQYRDGQLVYDLCVRLTVLYCAQDSSTVQSVTQQLEYTKQLPLPGDGSLTGTPRVRISAETAYLNCRAVSSRRIDLRGALRIAVHVTAEQPREVLRGAEGLHIQTRSEAVRYAETVVRTEKTFPLSETLEVPPAQPAMLSVLRDAVSVRITEARIAAGKLLCKGEAAVTLLYAAAGGAETLQAVFPFSQIAEQAGLRDEMPLTVRAEAVSRLMTPEAQGDGDLRTVRCDMQIRLTAEACETAGADLLTDAYSTVHPVQMQSEQIPLLTAPAAVQEETECRAVLTAPEGCITQVYAAWAVPEQIACCDAPAGGTQISGMLRCCVLAADADGMPLMLEDTVPFSAALSAVLSDRPEIAVGSCSYTLTGTDAVTVQTVLRLSGNFPGVKQVTLLTDLSADPDSRIPAADDYALRLYYGQPGESLWEIAKQCHTVPDAVRAENDAAGDVLTEAQMLLIPNVK